VLSRDVLAILPAGPTRMFEKVTIIRVLIFFFTKEIKEKQRNSHNKEIKRWSTSSGRSDLATA
jgi:hypothetical protein